MDTVLDATIEAHRRALEAGTLLFDPTDPGTEPRLIVALTAEIVDGTGAVVSKRFEFVTLTSTVGAAVIGPAPYLDLQPLPEHARPAAETVLAGRRVGRRCRATRHLLGDHPRPTPTP